MWYIPDRSYTTICPLYCVTSSSYSSIESQLDNAIAAWVQPISGCTDSLANNYNSLATIDDSSCTYMNCSDPSPTGLANNWVTDTKAEITWDNMNNLSLIHI